MKIEEELCNVLNADEIFPLDKSEACLVSVDRGKDEVLINVVVAIATASGVVNAAGVASDIHKQEVHYLLPLNLRLSALLQMLPGEHRGIPEGNYTLLKTLEEANKEIVQLRHALDNLPETRELFKGVTESIIKSQPLLGAPLAGQCSHATGKHDEECDLVRGLSDKFKEEREMLEAAVRRCDNSGYKITELEKQLQDAREEVLDLFRSHCPVISVGLEYRFNTMSSRTYEYAQDLLIQWGLLKPEQCLSCATPLGAKTDVTKVELPFPLKQVSIDILKEVVDERGDALLRDSGCKEKKK